MFGNKTIFLENDKHTHRFARKRGNLLIRAFELVDEQLFNEWSEVEWREVLPLSKFVQFEYFMECIELFFMMLMLGSRRDRKPKNDRNREETRPKHFSTFTVRPSVNEWSYCECTSRDMLHIAMGKSPVLLRCLSITPQPSTLSRHRANHNMYWERFEACHSWKPLFKTPSTRQTVWLLWLYSVIYWCIGLSRTYFIC